MLSEKITDGLYAIPVGAVNIFLLDSPDGCALIDTGFPGSADKILQAIGELGKKASDIRHILLTHAHPDHIGSLAALKQATGAQAYVHPLDHEIASSGKGFRPIRPAPSLMNRILFRIFINPDKPPKIEATTVEHVVQNGDHLPIAGGLKAIHTPGHSGGHLVYLWPQHGGVLIAGDTCQNTMGLSWSLGYEDFAAGQRSLAQIAQLNFEIACFGHGKAILKDASAQFKKKWG